MDDATQRNLGLGLMIGGGLSMAGALVAAGYARTQGDLVSMREAWVSVAATAVALVAGTLVLELRRQREAAAASRST